MKSTAGDWPLFQLRTTLGSVTIVNLSPNALVISGVDVVGTPGSAQPLVLLEPNGGAASGFETAATLQFDVRRTVGTSYVDIEQRSRDRPGPVIAGPINNPLGLTRLVNLNGSITFTVVGPAPSPPTSWTCTRRTARSAAVSAPLLVDLVRYTSTGPTTGAPAGTVVEPRLVVDALATCT